MALDATVAGAGSNTYATLQEAKDYFTARPGAVATAVGAANDATIENALVVAAEMMECLRYFRSKWSEAMGETAQALKFPREHHVDLDGNPEVERSVKYAQIEQAGAMIAAQAANITGLDADTLSELRALGIDSVRVGTTSLSFGSGQTVDDPRKAELLELGFSQRAAALLTKYISRVGTISDDAQDLTRISELRRVDLFNYGTDAVIS